MPPLRAHHLTAVVAGRTLFADVTLHLTPGWTGLVGPNGAGKSTLLSMLAGALTPERGHVERLPAEASVVLVPQRTALTGEVESFASADDTLARRWRARLSLHGVERWGTLSFGEQKRWQLGAALWREPQVLLLDEPTNHLDAQATALVVSTLARLESVNVLVAHDRAVLDRLTTTTLRLHHGRLERWEGHFSAARDQWLAKEAAGRAEHQTLQREASRLRRSLHDARREHEAATRQRSAGARMKSRRDSDARGVLANFRAERAQGHLSSPVRRLEERVAEAQAAKGRVDVVFDQAPALLLPGERCPQPVVARLEPGTYSTPTGRVLFRLEAPVEVARDARLAVTGPNGSGKTTLLKQLHARLTVPPARALLMPQDLAAADALHDLEQLQALPRAARGRVLQWVHTLGVDPEGLLASAAPSAGEARLLHLALALEADPWLLLLDEPTNHLSFDLIERLERALQSLPCALVVVSHDAQLLEALATTAWRLGEDGAVERDR